jgi:hypothetical protein
VICSDAWINVDWLEKARRRGVNKRRGTNQAGLQIDAIMTRFVDVNIWAMSSVRDRRLEVNSHIGRRSVIIACHVG